MPIPEGPKQKKQATRNAQRPLAYMGVLPESPINFISMDRDPLSTDFRNYEVGDEWLNRSTGVFWKLESKNAGSGVWQEISSEALDEVIADVGSASPVDDKLKLLAGTNTNTTGVGDTLRVHLNDSIFLPNTNAAGTTGVIYLGGNRFISNYGTRNTFIGEDSGNTTLTAATAINNTFIGALSGTNITTGDRNLGAGQNSLECLTTGQFNCGIGQNALGNLETGSFNCTLGRSSLANLLTGRYNLALGNLVGLNYTSNESSNILIGPSVAGTALENNTIRIGLQGAGAGQQNRCFVAGIHNVVTSKGDELTVTVNSDGQLGTSTAFGPGVIINDYTDPGVYAWHKDPNCKQVTVYLWGGGGGGGSGRKGAAGKASGGGGGGVQSACQYTMPALCVGNVESVTVGSGGVGGSAISTDDTEGDPGTSGGESSFGEIKTYAFSAVEDLSTYGAGGSTVDVPGGYGAYVETDAYVKQWKPEDDPKKQFGYTYGGGSGRLTFGLTPGASHAVPEGSIKKQVGSFMLMNNGDLFCTGGNANGELGLGDTQARYVWTLTATDVVDVAQGAFSSYILKGNGLIYATGGNSEGQLGNGTYTNSVYWREMLLFGTIIPGKIYAGTSSFAAIGTGLFAGQAWGCGSSVGGFIGAAGNYAIAQQFTGAGAVGVDEVYFGYNNSVYILKTDAIWATGGNSKGELGVGDLIHRNAFTACINEGSAGVTKFIPGFQRAYILKTDAVYGTGLNTYGELGTGDTVDKNEFTACINEGTANVDDVFTVNSVVGVMFALKSGALFGTGTNADGQLGTGDNANKDELTACINAGSSDVEEVYTVRYPSSNSSTMIRKLDAVYGTGKNTYGIFGTGNTTTQNEFTIAIGAGAANVTQLFVGRGLSWVLSDGDLYGSGRNTSGALGVGDGTNRLEYTLCDGITISPDDDALDGWNLEYANGYARGNLFLMPTSGGGGGGIGYNGGHGQSICKRFPSDFNSPVADDFLVEGGIGGTTLDVNGKNGNNGVASGGLISGGTGGGGGASDGATVAGNGGNGGYPGGAGGGGAAGLDATYDSGKGGDGADGRVIVIQYLG